MRRHRRRREGPLPDAATLAARVAAYSPTVERDAWAATALILTDAAAGPEVLFIKRVSRPGDLWSGDMALPGGKHDVGIDDGPQATAAREALEEVGVVVGPHLARLDDQMGASTRKRVATFVYTVGGRPVPVPEPGEVEEAVWLPVRELIDPANRSRHLYRGVMPFPALEVHGYTVWGMTLRTITHFLEIARLR